MAELCRTEGINQNLYYRWSKDFLEAGKKRLAGDTAREATSDEVKGFRTETHQLKEPVFHRRLGPVNGVVSFRHAGPPQWTQRYPAPRKPSGSTIPDQGKRSCDAADSAMAEIAISTSSIASSSSYFSRATTTATHPIKAGVSGPR